MVHAIAYWKPTKEDNKNQASSSQFESINFPPSAYVRFNSHLLSRLNRLDDGENETNTRASVTLYKRNEANKGGPFVVGLTDTERDRIREQFYVVEVFESSKSSKYVFAKKKTNEREYIEELKSVNPTEYARDSGSRFHEVQFVRKFVCKETTAIDDEEDVDDAFSPTESKTKKKRKKRRYTVRVGRVEDAKAGSRMVCGSVVEVSRLDCVGVGDGKQEQEDDDGGEGAARTTKRKRTPPRSEKDAETDKKKLLRVLEKITATAEGILADERKESAKTAKAAKVGGGGGGGEDDDDDEKATKKEEGKKTGEFVDATAKWTLLLDQNDSGEETTTTASSGFDVHPAAMYCALVASAFE
ncbi:unnamed protein product [Bathycoccus prasinos]